MFRLRSVPRVSVEMFSLDSQCLSCPENGFSRLKAIAQKDRGDFNADTAASPPRKHLGLLQLCFPSGWAASKAGREAGKEGWRQEKRDGGRQGGRDGGRHIGRDGGREGWRKARRQGGMEGGRKGWREEGRDGGSRAGREEDCPLQEHSCATASTAVPSTGTVSLYLLRNPSTVSPSWSHLLDE